MICPECGSENQHNASYCIVCGTAISSKIPDRGSRLLFFGTPLAFMLIGMSFAWETCMDQPVESGTSIGLFFSTFFLGIGGGFWFASQLFSLPIDPSIPWKTGMLGVGQMILSVFLAFPIQEYMKLHYSNAVSIAEKANVTIGLIFMIFVPTILAALSSLLLKLRDTLPNDLKNYRENLSADETACEKKVVSRNWLRYVFGKYGTISIPILTFLVALSLILIMPPAKRNLMFGRLYSELGMYASAVKAADRATMLDPGLAEAFFLKGMLQITSEAQGESLEDSVKNLEKASAMEPDNVWFLYGLSLAYERTGKKRESVAAISRAIAHKRNDAVLWARKADLTLIADDFKTAIDGYKKALEIDPDNPTYMNNLSFSLLEAGQDFAWALELARKAIERDHTRPYIIDTLAWALYKNGLYAEAFQTLQPLKQKIATASAEIDFHYAVICKELSLLRDPQATFSEIALRPEVKLQPKLKKHLEHEIRKLHEAEKSPSNGEMPQSPVVAEED